MLALIDADIVCYRCAAVTANAAESVAKWQADQLLTRIVEDTNASDWKLYLSGENNFRYNLFPAYKANRKDMVKPKWLEQLREHLVLEWDATIADGYEADDALGIAMGASQADGIDSVCASIDKDLRQLPGAHYHFVNRTWLEVSVFEGWKNFYLQLLTGDATDNIKGCPGIGPVKSERMLRVCTTIEDFYRAAAAAYYEVYKDEWFKQLELNARLLYVLRAEGDSWKAPMSLDLPVKVPVASSSKSGTITSMEPTKVLTTNGILLDGQAMANSMMTSEKQD